MKRNLLLLLSFSLWLGCDSKNESVFDIEPALASYNDDAPVLRKSYCFDSSCQKLSNEEKFIYDTQGKLTRIDNFGWTGNGTMVLHQYSEYLYAPSGLVASKTEFAKSANQTDWVPYSQTEFEYEAGLLKVEKLYSFLYSSATKTLSRTAVNEFADGKKNGQRWFDAEGKLIYRVEYRYKNGVLNHETWYDAGGKANRTFEHKFSGNRRQIGEYLTGSRELLAMIEKSYDDQGRLVTQETKVNNPLLCALPPGKIRFTY
jgi:hypothetical protein